MLLSLLAMFGCKDKGRETVAEMQTLIHQNLKPGDSEAKIEGFLKQNRIPYDFDAFNHRFQSRVPSSEKTNWIGIESVVMIHIYVNEDRTFKNADVRMVYTWF